MNNVLYGQSATTKYAQPVATPGSVPDDREQRRTNNVYAQNQAQRPVQAPSRPVVTPVYTPPVQPHRPNNVQQRDHQGHAWSTIPAGNPFSGFRNYFSRTAYVNPTPQPVYVNYNNAQAIPAPSSRAFDIFCIVVVIVIVFAITLSL